MKYICCLLAICLSIHAHAQTNVVQFKVRPKLVLPDITRAIPAVQDSVGLYSLNLNNHSEEHDVNFVIKDIEDYLNSGKKERTQSDQLLTRYFNPIRHFFLTTTNKTSVATSFLYSATPYQFCAYNDTALTLYLYALKAGVTYNLDKMTEKRVMRSVIEQCMLPALKAVDEFTDSELKYIALSAYYGCKDTREGATKDHISAYCLTFVARLADLKQYAAGLITAKGLLTNADLYLSDETDTHVLNRVRISME
jgi:hypothetical protein